MALKGREIQLKMEQFLHYPKEMVKYSMILFHGKVLAPYRKIELLETLAVLFWDSAKL